MQKRKAECSKNVLAQIKAMKPGDRMMYKTPNNAEGRFMLALCESDETYMLTQGKANGGNVYWLNKISYDAARKLEALVWSCPLTEAFGDGLADTSAESEKP